MKNSPLLQNYISRKKLLLFYCILTSCACFAQKITIPMTAASWEYDSSKIEFVKQNSTDVMKGKNGAYYQAFLKNHQFANGTIEFDVALTGMGFPGINFRMSDDRKNGENFYIRSFGPVTSLVRTTLQYAAIIDGMSIWDLSDEYQAGATIQQTGWNHVKLVVSGNQMKAYVNDMSKPALMVPQLEGRQKSGGISLSGNVIYANLTITPDATEALAPESGYTGIYNDSRYLKNWQVSPPKDFPFGKDLVMQLPSMYGKLTQSELPDSTTQWTPVQAENRGIVNLTRIYGSRPNDQRRMAWVKTTVYSDKAQERTLSFGFSDEVWFFLNGQLLYVDKNYFGTPQQKNDGRCTIENAQIKLSLKEGKNEILIGLANYFYGWGIVARMDRMDGMKVE
ncbi:hypothetical protein QTN47_25160 [Danxiaibacter flavus]|uniref:DUF1080 domain-containing protein n=1 Tax=Danxiaibacter flavus TaxID=3049108 RepID=A0ABV3ZLR3_9BACT|nr:hypothetical protein QNM32_25165 [Chitinophagaceae bacterium DXS]